MAASTSAATSCASCVFGAVSSSILSYTSHVVETITVSVIPHVTLFSNGSQTTSYQSITLTEAIVQGYGTGTGGPAPTTYANEAEITWTVGDAVLTYPTSYVQYLGFAGAPVTSNDGQICAEQADVTSVQLPATTDLASFIYPISNATAAMSLPSELLGYLDGLATISSQFYGEALTACAPLASPLSTLAALVSRSDLPSTRLQSAVPKRFEGARRADSQQPLVTPPPNAGNGTLDKRQYGSGSGVGTGTAPAETYYTTSEVLSEASSSSSAVAESTAAPNVHSTAFVISAITGRAIVTTETAPSHASPTPPAPPPASPVTTHSSSAQPAGPSPSSGGASSNSGNGASGSDSATNGGSNSNGGSSNGGSGSEGSSSSDSGSSGSGSGDSPESNGASSSSGSSGSSASSGNNGGSGDSTGSGSSGESNEAGSADGTGASSGNSGSEQSGSGQAASPVADNLPTTASPDSSPNVSNLIGQIGSVATQVGSTPAAVSRADVSDLLGNIGNVAAAQTQSGSGAQPTVQQNQQTQQTTPAAAFSTGARPVFSFGSTVVSIQSDGQYHYGTQSLTPGSAFTIGTGSLATLAVLQTSGGSTELVIGGSTVQGSPASGQIATQVAAESQALVTAGGHTFTAVQTGGSVILADATTSMTIQDGSTAVFGGQSVSVASDGGAVVVGSQTIPISASITSGPEAVVTASGHTFTALQTGSSVVLQDASSTATVKDGSMATFRGQTVSVASDGSTIVVDGSSTLKLTTSASPSSSTGLAGYINSGLNAASGTGSTASSSPMSNNARSTQLTWGSFVCAFIFGLALALR